LPYGDNRLHGKSDGLMASGRKARTPRSSSVNDVDNSRTGRTADTTGEEWEQ
jgi:hypothetical protein